jgi:hypothetical protein
MADFINITALDKNSSESMSNTFPTNQPELLRNMVEKWEENIPYRRYELTTRDFIEDYSDEVQEILDVLEVE